jgi:large subunit ribosomal protein L35
LPKIKTHKATAKRFGYTGTGKLVRTKQGESHLRRHKSKRVKRLFGKMLVVDSVAERKRIARLAPYLAKQ